MLPSDDAPRVNPGCGTARLTRLLGFEHPRVAARLVGCCVALASACAPALPPPGARIPRELILAHDDNRATARLIFPNLTYESIVRFELPVGKHRALRLRMMAGAAGSIAITFYENSLFEAPGEEIQVITRALLNEDLSDGKDGRWVVEDLRDLPPLEGVVWVGVRKLAGDPSLWTSGVVSGQVYLRDRDPTHSLGLLPVKRTPMLRLEALP
ncbi:MAG: hypothetical protein H7X95_02930 [Deltaproteobacteria bacterium]|nr:hypothetical protein [Deltaproteobacteria bacterium]